MNARIHDGGPGERAYVREAAGVAIARRPRRGVRGTRRNGLVTPAGLVEQFVVLPKRAGDRAQTPLVRGAQAEFVLLVRIALDRVPGGTRRETGRREAAVVDRRTVALVVIGIHAARVIRVVADLFHVAHEIAAGINGLQIAELAIHRPRCALELVLVVSIVEQRDFERLQRRAIRGVGLAVEHAPRVHVLVGLRDQEVPLIAEFVAHLRAYSLVGNGVDGSGSQAVVIDDRAAGRNAEAGVRQAVRALSVDRRKMRI